MNDVDPAVRLRAGLLAAGLRRLGLGAGKSAAILMEDLDCEDAQVAVLAGRLLGLRSGAAALPRDRAGRRSMVEALATRRPDVVLACPRAATALLDAGARTVIIADAPRARWWRAIEQRESQTAREQE